MKILRWSLAPILIILIFATACGANKAPDTDIREPAVAGKFYPQSAIRLRGAVEKFLQDALPVQVQKPVAIVVPHAGYVFSGQICADGFKQASRQKYDVIVILGTKHTPGPEKIALYPGSGFRTPLGVAQVQKSIIASLIKEDSADCILDKSLHESEHSVEVMVPFIQVLFPRAKIVPVVVGTPNADTCVRFGRALAKVLQNKNALIVASSDLSHYPSAEDANLVDRETTAAIAGLDIAAFHKTVVAHQNKNIPNLYTSACGEAPVMAAMVAAKVLGAVRGIVVSYANSGDTLLGERSRVVGYSAIVLTKDNAVKSAVIPTNVKPAALSSIALSPSDKKTLLRFARETISRIFLTETTPLPRSVSEAVKQKRGAFVTLRKKGELRGCVGRMNPDEPLIKTVGAMAVGAAFNDGRFNPLAPDELKDIEIEISVLTPMKEVARASDIMVGRDGVVLGKDGHHAVFLPQVATEQGWGREEMLDNLCRKAGLETGCWKENAQFSTFQAIVFSESQFK